MKQLLLIFVLLISFISRSQFTEVREQRIDASWDQGVPFLPEDEYITNLTEKLTFDSLLINNKHNDKNTVKLCREIGIAFYNRGIYDAADWYLSRVKEYVEHVDLEPEKKQVLLEESQKPNLPQSEIENIKKDEEILKSIPKSYDNLSMGDLENLAKKIDVQINKLTNERDSLLNTDASDEVIESKNGTIKTLKKEKDIIVLTIDKTKLKKEKKLLGVEKEVLKNYIIWLLIVGSILVLTILVLIQRKTIKVQDKEIDEQLKDINKKNSYLEHAARFIRHDMHSGINTYIPRGITSLEKRLNPEELKKLKIDGSVKMIKEGLNHTQKVYKNVYEFTNLVKQNTVLDKQNLNLREMLSNYVKSTSYSSQVEINDLINLNVNEILFCNAIDNLIKNGLKYNNSETKFVKIFMENNYLVLQDNGVGMTQNQFEKICNNYNKKNNKDIDKDTYGLGLNICLAILNEHGFDLNCEKNEIGTKMKIKIK